jgi:hypothetical protein
LIQQFSIFGSEIVSGSSIGSEPVGHDSPSNHSSQFSGPGVGPVGSIQQLSIFGSKIVSGSSIGSEPVGHVFPSNHSLHN